MTDPARAQEVAGRLRHSEKRWIMDCPREGARWGVYVAHDLAQRDLCNPTGWPIRLTPLGLEVRRILMEQQHDQ